MEIRKLETRCKRAVEKGEGLTGKGVTEQER